MSEITLTESNQLPAKIPARKSVLGIKERREQQLNELIKQVAQKLMKDMVMGRVGFFHDKKTGQLVTEVYGVDLKSSKHPNINVSVWKHFVRDEDPIGPSFRIVFNIWDSQFPNTDKSTMFSIVQKWDTPPGSFELKVSLNDKPKSHKETINFLRDVLETEVNEESVARHFGRPYHKGDFVNHAEDGWRMLHHDGKEIPDPDLLEYRGQIKTLEGSSEYSAYWMRDLLPEGVSLLDSGPLPEPKILK
jgi:hypothetical protein